MQSGSRHRHEVGSNPKQGSSFMGRKAHAEWDVQALPMMPDAGTAAHGRDHEGQAALPIKMEGLSLE